MNDQHESTGRQKDSLGAPQHHASQNPVGDPPRGPSIDPVTGENVEPVGSSQPKVDDTIVTDDQPGDEDPEAPHKDPDGSARADDVRHSDMTDDPDMPEPVTPNDFEQAGTEPFSGTPDPRQV